MSKRLKFSLLGASLLLLAVGTASAEHRCGVYSSHEWDRRAEREYRSCEECLRRNDRCEERCVEAGYVCTASGYDRRGHLQKVEGDFSDQQWKAGRRAEQRCRDQELRDCQVEHCSDKHQERVQPCWQERGDDRSRWSDQDDRWNRHERSDDHDGSRWDDRGGRRDRPERPLPPQQKYVVSWQHVKDQCFGKPYPKIAKQCGNKVGFWQGIHCQVTWSDGSTEEIGGKVDLTDPYGRKYCTRDTRPASFNCVSRCDDRPGPRIKLPRP